MIGWAGIAFSVIFVGAIGLYLLLGVAILVTHLVETRPLKFLVPAPADDPEWAKLPGRAPKEKPTPFSANPYEAPGAGEFAVVKNLEADSLGFAPSTLYAHAKGGTYKTHAVIWTSPTRQSLAFIGWGTIAKMNSDKTILYSVLDDGKIIVTSAKPTGAEMPGLYENVIVMGATFYRLVERHEERLRRCGRGVRRFEAEDALTDYEAIIERRFNFLVEEGDAYFVKPERVAIRSTLKGAVKAYLRTLRTPAGLEREDAPAGRGGPVAFPAWLVWMEWGCYMALFAGAVLNARGKATTPSQQIFRLAVFAGSVAGLLLTYIFKSIFKRRAR